MLIGPVAQDRKIQDRKTQEMADAIPMILGSKTALMGTPTIGQNFDRERYAAVRALMERNIRHIAEIGAAFKTATPGDAMNVIIDSQIKFAQEDIFRSFLKPDFLGQCNGEYFEFDLGYRKMFENLDIILGIPTDEEKAEKAETVFEEMVRRAHINETFSAFFNRLEAQAGKFIDDDGYLAKRVAKQFKRSVREMDENLLMVAEVNCTVTGLAKTKWQAQQLDNRGMHKRVERSVRELQDASRVENSILALTQQVGNMGQQLTTQMSHFMQEQKTVNDRTEARVVELERRIDAFSGSHFLQNAAHFPTHGTVGHAGQAMTHQVSQSWPRVGKPDTVGNPKSTGPTVGTDGRKKSWQRGTRQNQPCYECGLIWHKSEDCPGPCNATCYLCNLRGHTSSSRRYHGVKTPEGTPAAKNE